MSFMFFFSPMPLPALTTRSAWVMGVSMGMPTVKSWPSFFNAATRASTRSWAVPSFQICFLRSPVSGPCLRTGAASAFPALPRMWEAMTTR